VFNTTFQVMGISLAYSILVGRLKIHSLIAIPLTLYQKLKFIVDENLVVIERMDDMITKSQEEKNKLFKSLRKFQLKLNPVKYTFRVTSNKPLEFTVRKEGIKVYLYKLKAILEIPHSQTQTEVRSFLERLNFIDSFICRLTPACEPIFKLLQKN